MKYEITGPRLSVREIYEIHQRHRTKMISDGRPGPVVLLRLYKGRARSRPTTMYASVYIESSFLQNLIKRAVQNAGSMRRLSLKVWGARRQSSSYFPNSILAGKCGIPIYRLKRLCDSANVSFSEADKHVLKIVTRSEYAYEVYSKKRQLSNTERGGE